MFKKIYFFLYLLLTLSCSSSENECNLIDVVCTEEFRYITVEIVDSKNEPIVLDSYKIIRNDTDEDITHKEDMFQNSYPIINDSYQNEIANKKLSLTFTGVLNNQEVINEIYIVSADCCHIDLISGKTKIIL